ncbi:MAG: SpoIID/LytB domain-containing protein [Blastocatellia bacterium]|nr:SpoIID/LytB domain-containing protein [Blastocatellia bacterium]
MRITARLLLLAIVVQVWVPVSADAELPFVIAAEPRIRVGLVTNASSVNVTTADSQLLAYAPGEPVRHLATNRVSVTARAYRPPVVDHYIFEIQNLATADEASAVAADVREATGESALVSLDAKTNRWKVWIGEPRESKEDADAFRAALAQRGFSDVTVVVEKRTVHSPDAVALSDQVRTAGKSEVRSLVRTTGSAQVTGEADAVVPGLREVIVNGSAEAARYTSLKAVSFGSFDERSTPVRLNGTAYRGRLEVFVNSRGTLSVVNEVPLEDYLLGVVPAELSLPQLEAQKAQAVAARTYAIANIDRFARQGFDVRPDVWSQVYKGVSIETPMGTRAVRETAGMVAMHGGKPIMAYYTSTCGGRTENSENVFEKAEPYLRGVECSLEGRRHFDPFMVKTSRQPPRLRDEGNVELARLMSMLSINGFALSTQQITDEWLEDVPSTGEISNWMNNLASKFSRTWPNVTAETAKPINLAGVLSSFLYEPGAPDTLLSDSDVLYHLSFDDASEIPLARRAEIAMLMRDGYFTLRPDLTLQPNRPFSRAKFLRLIRQIYEKRKWMPSLQTATARPTIDGKLVVRVGRTDRPIDIRPDVFLFRQYGSEFYGVREAALVGGEEVRYQTDASGAIFYMEIVPTSTPTVAENMSPFTNWSETVAASTVQSRLSRYVRGIGTLYDVNVKSKGYSRRATEIEIVGSNGVKTLKGGRIRSALRLREQLFVIEKLYSGDRVVSYTFTGRGWGHGVGMCQYGAFGLARMGVKYDDIIRHYYTGVDVTKVY